MEANEDFKVTKIPLEMFINLLVVLYEEGANFIDLSAEVDKDEETDTIKIGVREDYYDNDDEEEDDEVQQAKIIKLSDDDINNLI
jgi:hypothetical protein